MKHDCIGPLIRAGIEYEDALALRRIAMTLDRWHEMECGNSNSYGSWAIERDETETGDGLPYLVHHQWGHGRWPDSTTRTRIPDREKGALKRLAKIMARYPALGHYVQTDPRGASIYILRPGDVPEGEAVDCYYSRGLAVYKQERRS